MEIVGSITDWFIYRRRYVLAYSLLAIIIGSLLFFHPSYIPSGISDREIQSVVSSESLSFTEMPHNAVDLPYHILQKISISLFGISPLGVRLPSMIIAIFTAVLICMILHRWFKTNVAITGAVIILASSWFLSIARLGTPDIMIAFWSVLIIILATYYSQRIKHGHLVKAALGITLALSFYTPYMFYLFAAMALSVFLQPHLRYLLKETSKVGYLIAAFFLLLILAPLIWTTYNDPSTILTLLNFNAATINPIDYAKNLIQMIANTLNPGAISSNESIFPLVGLTTGLIISMGVYRLFKDAYSIRSHLLIIWSAIILTVVCLNPTNLTPLFVPAMLILAIGLNLVLLYWYQLFPRNPYARIFGLLPIALLIFSIISLEYNRYFNTMFYSVESAKVFQPDVFMAQVALKNIKEGKPITIVVENKYEAIYDIIAKTRPGTTVESTKFNFKTTDSIMINANIWQFYQNKLGTPTKVVVDDRKDDALRFAIYER